MLLLLFCFFTSLYADIKVIRKKEMNKRTLKIYETFVESCRVPFSSHIVKSSSLQFKGSDYANVNVSCSRSR